MTSKLIEALERLRRFAELLRQTDKSPAESLWLAYPAGQGIYTAQLASDIDAALAEAATPPQVNGEAGLEAAKARLASLARDCDAALRVIGHASARRDITKDRDAIHTVLEALSGRQTEGAEPVATDGSETGIAP